jgi:iron(III) transport system substrate-binding protein
MSQRSQNNSPAGPPRRGVGSFTFAALGGRLGWAIIAILIGAGLLFFSRTANPRFVVVYTSQDQVYAEPILKEFERFSGVQVKAVYDSEAVKTVGLANRLLAERGHPRCDVFWSNEELRTQQLAAEGVFREENPVAAFGYRSRRIVINTNHLALAQAPASLLELTNDTWRARVALAYPLFGTTATHFLALRQEWGEQGWRNWCRALQANQPFLVDGNSVVVRLVGRGEAWIGLTDSDDIAAGQREGLPIAPVEGAEMFYIRNTVAVIRGAPNPELAQQLFEFLQRPEVVKKLVEVNALEGSDPPPGTGITPDWDKLLKEIEPGTAALKEIFLR